MFEKDDKALTEAQKKTIGTLRELIKKHHHLIKVKTDSEFLLRFLRLTEFNVHEAFKRYDLFYAKRTELKQWFLDRDPLCANNQQQLELGQIVPLPGVDAKGRKVILVRGGLYDPKQLALYLKMQYVSLDIVSMDSIAQTDGIVLLVDQEKFTLQHSLHCNFSDTKNAVNCWQDVYPIKNQAVYLYKAGKAYDTLFNMIRTFMNEHNRKRFIIIGSNMSKLHEKVPVEILPTEYGGRAGPLQNMIDDWKNKVQSYRQMYLDEDKLYPWVDETKRNLPMKKENSAVAKPECYQASTFYGAGGDDFKK